VKTPAIDPAAYAQATNRLSPERPPDFLVSTTIISPTDVDRAGRQEWLDAFSGLFNTSFTIPNSHTGFTSLGG
jgi:hypothetical protein